MRLVQADRRTVRAAGLALVALCSVVPFAKTAVINAALKNDTRVRGSAWINENIEPGADICLDDAFYSPRPDAERFGVHYTSRMYHYPLQRLQAKHMDYVVLNSFRYERYVVARRFTTRAAEIYALYREIMDAGELVHEIRPALPWQTYGFHNPVIWIYRLPPGPPPDSW
jgi:hypothetical protein